jgi:UDP-N-acetylglucosamine transferase subunit ALG13
LIFLTIGTHEPFDRLVRAVDLWAAQGKAQVFGQITAPAREQEAPKHFEWVTKLSPADYEAKVKAADFLVAHAGMGSIITALNHGKPIVVMPRRGHLKETRNDHQWATAKRLTGRPGIVVADDEAALPDVLDRVLAGGGPGAVESLPPYAEPRLIEALRRFVFEGAA